MDAAAFLSAAGQHDPAKYMRWRKRRLRTIRSLHATGHRELDHFCGWDCVRGMSVLKEFGLLVTRVPLSVYDMYTMSPTEQAGAWLSYEERLDIICVKPRKRKALKAQMDAWLKDSPRGWFDRYHNDYLTEEQKAQVHTPGYGWPVMREMLAEGQRIDAKGWLRLDAWMEKHDLCHTHLELAGVLAPHPTNLHFDQLLSLPTRFGSRFISTQGQQPLLVLKQTKADALLRRVKRFGSG